MLRWIREEKFLFVVIPECKKKKKKKKKRDKKDSLLSYHYTDWNGLIPFIFDFVLLFRRNYLKVHEKIKNKKNIKIYKKSWNYFIANIVNLFVYISLTGQRERYLILVCGDSELLVANTYFYFNSGWNQTFLVGRSIFFEWLVVYNLTLQQQTLIICKIHYISLMHLFICVSLSKLSLPFYWLQTAHIYLSIYLSI